MFGFSLVKMVYAFAAQSRDHPSPNQLTAAIRRNFGGLDSIDPVDVFREQLPMSLSPEKVDHKLLRWSIAEQLNCLLLI